MSAKDSVIRDEEWLENLLADIWYKYFSDVEQSNKVSIRFGRKAKRRLGSISMDPKDNESTVITINNLYKDPSVPEYVVKATIIHEMTHYAHGFNSPLKQKHKHPHSGGVIRREFAERGLENMYLRQQTWLKRNWIKVIEKHFASRPNNITYKYSSRKKVVVKLPWWIRIN